MAANSYNLPYETSNRLAHNTRHSTRNSHNIHMLCFDSGSFLHRYVDRHRCGKDYERAYQQPFTTENCNKDYRLPKSTAIFSSDRHSRIVLYMVYHTLLCYTCYARSSSYRIPFGYREQQKEKEPCCRDSGCGGADREVCYG